MCRHHVQQQHGGGRTGEPAGHRREQAGQRERRAVSVCGFPTELWDLCHPLSDINSGISSFSVMSLLTLQVWKFDFGCCCTSFSRARAHNRLESRYSNSSGGSYEDEKSEFVYQEAEKMYSHLKHAVCYLERAPGPEFFLSVHNVRHFNLRPFKLIVTNPFLTYTDMNPHADKSLFL